MTVSLGTDRARFSLVLLEKTTTKQNGEKVEMKGTGNGRALKIVLVAAVFSCTGTAGAGQNLAELQKWSDGFAEVVAQVKPGVVAISTESKSRGEVPNYRGTPFEFFFRGPPRQGQGSGVIVSHEGEYFILTNYHVIRGADEITVELTDERHFSAEVVGTDSLSDLAALRIDAAELPSVSWGRSADLRVGEWVLAVGNPFGYEHTVTQGIISALGRARFGEEYGSFIQTSAAINPGNSGGPLVNLKGELVGINTAIVTRSGGDQGIGFAIPVDLARDVLSQLIDTGEVRRGLLGILIRDIPALMAEAMGMENTRGVLVTGVTKDSGAEEAGLQVDDVIVAVDGDPVRNSTELRSRIGTTFPGTKVEVELLRDGKRKTVPVKLGEVTQEALARGRSGGEEAETTSLGIRLRDLTPELAQRFGYDEDEGGVLITGIRSGSEAARRGLGRGDLVVEVNRQPVASVQEYREIVEELESGAAVLFRVRRGETNRLVALRLP